MHKLTGLITNEIFSLRKTQHADEMNFIYAQVKGDLESYKTVDRHTPTLRPVCVWPEYRDDNMDQPTTGDRGPNPSGAADFVWGEIMGRV